MNRIHMILVAGMLVLAGMLMMPTCAAAQEKQRQYTVGLVSDPGERHTRLSAMAIDEARQTLQKPELPAFPADRQFVTDGTVDNTTHLLLRILSDPEVDLVLVTGPVAAAVVSRMQHVPKPVIATGIIDAQLQGLPVAEGVSGRKNFNYISGFRSLPESLTVFAEQWRLKRISVVVPSAFLEAARSFESRLHQALAGSALKVQVISADRGAGELTDRIDSDTEGLLITSLPALTTSEQKILADQLNQRGITTLLWQQTASLEAGFTASMIAEDQVQRLARRLALNMRLIQLGRQAGELPVTFAPGYQLKINVASLEQTGRYPSWEVLSEAELTGEHHSSGARDWTLPEVMKRAPEVNLSMQKDRLATRAREEDITLARSARGPQLSGGLNARVIDADRAEASFGNQPEFLLSGRVTAHKLLYSESVDAHVDITRLQQTAREEVLEITSKDLSLEAAEAFLSWLKAQALLRISEDNVALTRNNLELAEVRRRIGVSGKSDVLRWRSELSTSRTRRNTARDAVEQARLRLNLLLNRPLQEQLNVTDSGLDISRYLPRQAVVLNMAGTPPAFRVLQDFLIRKGMEQSPELKALDAAIAATERRLTNARTRRFSPTLVIQASLEQRLLDGGEGTEPPAFGGRLPISFPEINDTAWNAGLSLTYDFYRGGATEADVRQATMELAALKTERAAIMERIDARIRSAAHTTGVQLDTITHSARAADAAAENLSLVSDAYSRGVVEILQLLDAQHVALAARQAQTVAVYDCMISLMRTERATGAFLLLLDEKDWQSWREDLQAFFEASGVQPQKWNNPFTGKEWKED